MPAIWKEISQVLSKILEGSDEFAFDLTGGPELMLICGYSQGVGAGPSDVSSEHGKRKHGGDQSSEARIRCTALTWMIIYLYRAHT